MKFSEAMLKGFEKVDGRQSFDLSYWTGPDPRAPESVCVMGAYCLTRNGSALNWQGEREVIEAFELVWGVSPHELNDDEKLPWEHIYGMAVAAGL